MQCLVCAREGSTRGLRVTERAAPVPGRGQVLVRIACSTIERTDLVGFDPRVTGPMRLLGAVTAREGVVLGSEAAGTVVDVGPGVRSLSPGDQVFCATGFAKGAWAELAVAAEEETCLVPAGLTVEQASCLALAPTVALGALRAARVDTGGREILVHGASGGVGLALVWVAAALGDRVTAVCGGRSADTVLGAGAEKFIDRHGRPLAARPELRGRFDAVLGVNGRQPLALYRSLLRRGGCYVGIGGAVSQIIGEITARPLFALHGRRSTAVTYPLLRKDLPTIRRLVETSGFVPVVDELVEACELPGALPELLVGHRTGRVVVRMRF